MTSPQQTLLYLLRLALGFPAGEAVDLFALKKADWEALVGFSFDQGVAAIAVDGLQLNLEVVPEPVEGSAESLELALNSPELEDLKYEWFGEVFSCEEDYSKQKEILHQLIQVLSEHNIKVLLLKGLGLSKYYPVPAHRPMGDFDIYSYGHHFEVDKIFSDKGFSIDREHEKHSVFNFEGVTVENHYLYLDSFQTKCEKRVQAYLESLNDDILNEDGYYTPSPLKNYFFLLCHMARHFSEFESIRLRHLLDWGLFLKAEMSGLDLQLVRRKLQEFGLERTNDLFVSLAEKVCGLDFSDLLFKRLPEAECSGVLEYILTDKQRLVPKYFVSRFIYKLKTLAGNNWKFRHLAFSMGERVWFSVKMHLLGKVEI